MKNVAHKLILLIALVAGHGIILAQVSDLPEAFSIRGYIQNIKYDEKLMLVNFIEKNNVESAVIHLDSTLFFNNDRKPLPLTINDFKSNCEVAIKGEKFTTANRMVAKSIILKPAEISSKLDGRVDYIKDDLAIVDGCKVKLKSEVKIKGKSKTAYEPYTKTAVNELKLGILASVDGKLDANDFILASKFTMAPDTDDKFDNAAAAVDKENYEKFAPVWSDKAKRKPFLGAEIDGVGTIVNDNEIQDYVAKVGQKLVPNYLTDRIQLIFIVVDNPEASANVRANGLAYVNTGLLKILDNEAQLATALGHEIAHVLYKHSAEELNTKSDADKKKESTGKGAGWLEKVYKKVPGVVKDRVGLGGNVGTVAEITIETNDTKAVTELKKSYIDKRTSRFSIDKELQADRVGLALMVLAGYDPREAPILWKNQIIGYDNSEVKAAGKDFKETLNEKVAKEKENEEKKAKNKNKKPETTTGASNDKTNEETEEGKSDTAFSLFTSWKTDDNKAKSLETHPGEIQRFEALNHLIVTMWGNEEIYKSAQVGEKSYIKIKKKLKGLGKK